MIQTISTRMLAAGLVGLALLGCDGITDSRQGASGSSETHNPVTAEKRIVDPQFEKAASAVAGEYRNWSMIDDEWRWAPTLCDSPSPTRQPRLSQLRKSESGESASHGRKMYRIFAKDGAAYAKLSEGIAPSTPRETANHVAPEELKTITQVIVKESWIPQHVAAKANANANAPSNPAKTTKPLKQSDLFMMLKVGGEKTAGTDEGWVYATVTPDGKEVTGAGRMENCMKCHADAPHGRLFGLRPVITKSN